MATFEPATFDPDEDIPPRPAEPSGGPSRLQPTTAEGAEGVMLLREVQPGLSVMGYDVRFSNDTHMRGFVEPGTLCIIPLAGEPYATTINEDRKVSFEPNKPIVTTFRSPALFESTFSQGARRALCGFRLDRAFLDHFHDDDAGRSRVAVERMLSGEILGRRLMAQPALTNLARQLLYQPYIGVMDSLFTESCTLALLVGFGRLLDQTDQDRMSSSLTAKQKDRVRRAKELIDGAIFSPPTIRNLANDVGINPTTLRTEFQMAYGNTIFGYIHAKRMRAAQQLLRSERLPVSQIAYRVGYKSAAAFSTAFRRHFGYPPSAAARCD